MRSLVGQELAADQVADGEDAGNGCFQKRAGFDIAAPDQGQKRRAVKEAVGIGLPAGR